MRSAVGGVERVGAHVLVAVVGRRRAVVDEVPAAGLHRRDEPRVVVRVRARHLGQPRHPLRPAGASPPRGSDRAGRSGSRGRSTSGRRPAPRARPGRRTGRRWWPAPRSGTARTGRAAGRRARRAAPSARRRSRPPIRARTTRDAEDLHQLVLEPIADRRAAEDVPVGAHPPPDVPRLRLGRWWLRDAERVERDAGRVQQAGHVVIGRHQQRRRVGERLVRPAAAAGRRARGARSPAGRARRRTAHARSRGPRARRAAGDPGGGRALVRRPYPYSGAILPAGSGQPRRGDTLTTLTLSRGSVGPRRGPRGRADPALRPRSARRQGPRRPQRLRVGSRRHPLLSAATADHRRSRRAGRPGVPADRDHRAGHPRTHGRHALARISATRAWAGATYPGRMLNHAWWNPATFAFVGKITADRSASSPTGAAPRRRRTLNRAVVETT